MGTDDRTTRLIGQWFAAGGVGSDVIESLAEQGLRTAVAEDVRLVESVQQGPGERRLPARASRFVIDPAGGVNSEHSIRALYDWGEEAMA